ncbi:hypothetical protein C8J57DRAFT_1528546 [Mycena rebaudengoi]|nr:hypothetical protein C8J57DRAFT_1528546 [Mycena rebaudengoi]
MSPPQDLFSYRPLPDLRTRRRCSVSMFPCPEWRDACRFHSPQLPSLKTPQTPPLLGGQRIQSQPPSQALLSRGEVLVRSQHAVQSNYTQRPGGAVCAEAPPCRATPRIRCLQPAGRRAAGLQSPPAAHPRRQAPNIGRKLIDIRLSLNAFGRVTASPPSARRPRTSIITSLQHTPLPVLKHAHHQLRQRASHLPHVRIQHEHVVLERRFGRTLPAIFALGYCLKHHSTS